MSDLARRQAVVEALSACASGPLKAGAHQLLHVLEYRSEKTVELTSNTADEFLSMFRKERPWNDARGRAADWRSIDVLCQITDDEVGSTGQTMLQFDSTGEFDGKRYESFLFVAIDLQATQYTRTALAEITREVNKLFAMPVIVLFRHGDTVSLSVIDRRLSKTDAARDVLEKVTLIKDIRCVSPHRAHTDILAELSLRELREKEKVTSFVALHGAWRKTLDISALNKRFFKDLANWYFWALRGVEFPGRPDVAKDVNRATAVIRLITRVIFCWFIKEKGLIPGDLFEEAVARELLNDVSPDESTYYKAVLQNLFFGTLNTEGDRSFRAEKQSGNGYRSDHMVHTRFRYRDQFRDAERFVGMVAAVPYLNGGLFECLDRKIGDRDVREDGFSDRADNPLFVPNRLFFGDEHEEDLNSDYGTKAKQYKVRGLLHLLAAYKFTVAENTPIEEEVALDPELLGRAFENLLASYNPETKLTARKETGSFYTPRNIVDYMVDEALIAVLVDRLDKRGAENAEARLRRLFEYSDDPVPFGEDEVALLVSAISGLRVLDPACGSGAFPMGVLHRLVNLLHRLDPENRRWRRAQMARANAIEEAEARDAAIETIEREFGVDSLDYARKLYLIENCIFGVDIQPAAIQIAKLRFFISLVVDQPVRDDLPNRGIHPLPNLETKLVAADTLLPLQPRAQQPLPSTEMLRKRDELADARRRYYTAHSWQSKKRWRDRDKAIRAEMVDLLTEEAFSSEAIARVVEWDPYDQNAHASWFEPTWMFGVEGGFDVTLGNPPYVRADASPEHVQARKAILANGIYETLWEKWDLFVPFIERAYKLLRPGGVTTMIVSDAFCHSKYAQKPQEWYLKNARVLRLDFVSDVKVFDAGVHNMIYLFEKAAAPENRPLRRVHEGEFGKARMLPTGPQGTLTHRAFFPDSTAGGFAQANTIPLEGICYISVGMVVNSDEDGALGEFRMPDLLSDSEDDEHPKRFVEGKQLECWLPASNRWLEWGTDRAPARFRRRTFPELHEAEEKLLVQRSPGPDPKACYDGARCHFTESSVASVLWHHLSGVRNNSLKKAARYRDEKRRPGLPRREDLEATSGRFSVKYLLAVMNSSVARDFLRANRRSNIHLYPDDWKKLPIPDVPPEKQAPIVAVVERILAAKRADPNADIRELEDEVDRLVRELYGV